MAVLAHSFSCSISCSLPTLGRVVNTSTNFFVLPSSSAISNFSPGRKPFLSHGLTYSGALKVGIYLCNVVKIHLFDIVLSNQKERRPNWTFYLINTGLEHGERSGMLYNMLRESRMRVKMRDSEHQLCRYPLCFMRCRSQLRFHPKNQIQGS